MSLKEIKCWKRNGKWNTSNSTSKIQKEKNKISSLRGLKKLAETMKICLTLILLLEKEKSFPKHEI